MPVVKELRVVVGERKYGGGLQTGDTVTIRGRSGTVQSQRELNTNMEVCLADGEESWTRRVPLGSEINVLRTMPTDAESDAEEMEKFLMLVMKKFEDYRRFTKHAASIVMELFRDSQAKGHLYPWDLDRAAEVAQYQETLALWEHVRSDIQNAEGEDAMAALKSVMLVRQICQERLLYSRNALSRSSSVISNLTDDLRNEAAVKFLHDTKHMGAERLWERHGAGEVL